MVPPLPQLLPDPSREVVDEPGPAALAVRGDERAELGVLLLRPLALDLGDRVAAAAAAVGGGAGGGRKPTGGAVRGRKAMHPLSLAASAAVVAGTTALVSYF